MDLSLPAVSEINFFPQLFCCDILKLARTNMYGIGTISEGKSHSYFFVLFMFFLQGI